MLFFMKYKHVQEYKTLEFIWHICCTCCVYVHYVQSVYNPLTEHNSDFVDIKLTAVATIFGHFLCENEA